MKYVGDRARDKAHYREDGHWPPPELGDESVSSGELQAFLLEHREVTSKSVKVQRALAYIARFRAS